MMLEPRDISKLRKKLGLTQTQLARLANVSQSLVAKIESGRVDPSYSKAKSLFEALQRLQRRNSRKAGEIMSKELVHICLDDTVEVAAKLMHERAISQLPVVEEGRPVGSVTEKTILRLLSEARDPKQAFSRNVREVMDENFPTVSEETPVELLYSLLDYFQAVLVSKRDKVLGIISKADLLRLES